MKMDTWLCAWRELRRRKARTLASVIGYAMAVAVMVVVGTSQHAAREAADRVLQHTGTHFIAFVPMSDTGCPGCTVKRPEMPQEGFVASGVPAALFPVGLIHSIKNLPTVKDASPCLLFRFQDPADGVVFTVAGFDVKNHLAVGTTCCAATDIISGRFLNTSNQNNVLVEEAYARLRNLKVGDPLQIAHRPFSIVGIVNPGIRPAKADIYMPYEEAEKVINTRLAAQPIQQETNIALVEVAHASVQEEAIRAVRELLSGSIVSSYACYQPAGHVIGINKQAAYLLAGILGTCVLLLAVKTEWTWVLERRREIGILKAIGWSDGSVVRLIIVESILQAAAGGLLGGCIAIFFLWLGPDKMSSGIGLAHLMLRFLVYFLVAFALAVGGGLLAGVGPALMAARKRPADALRTL